MPQQASTTLQQLLAITAQRFESADLTYGHGTDNAHDDAAWLLAFALGLDVTQPLPLEQLLSDEQVAACETLVKRRVTERLPVAYLTGEAWFGGLPYYVSHDTLVPRSPLAELIGARFEPFLDAESIGTALDLCTGNGCIAIATTLALPDAKVHAVDISAPALAVAERNRQRHEVAGRLELFEGDLFSPLPKGTRYDLILSNPPYVDAQDMADLSAEFKHEPALGLAAGGDGLDIALQMLAEAPQWLTPQGLLVCEVGNSAEALEARFPQVPFNWLEFEYGGLGIFALYAEEIELFARDFADAWQQRSALLNK